MTVDEANTLARSVDNYLLIIKANEMHYLSTLFGKELHVFRTDLLSETCRVLYQIKLRNSAPRWLLV